MKTKLKISKLFRRSQNKLRVAAARRPLRIAAAARECEEMAEPNMKLSRALLIVLLLHVVAVAGIIAFNAIKTRQGSIASIAAPATKPADSTLGSTSKSSATSPPSIVQKGNAKSVVKESGKSDRARQNENVKSASDSGKVYVVAKGDNPVTIAKKFKVSYDDLIALNHIDDPRKLQIGQRVLIPARITKPRNAP